MTSPIFRESGGLDLRAFAPDRRTIAGLGTLHFAYDLVFPQFLGAMLGRYYFRKRFGHVKWRAYAPILMAGYGCGVGLIGMTTVALKLISSAVKQTIF